MNTMTLSLIIPVYKVADYIEACLHSVLASLPAWAEVIIVDDGSPDDSMAIAKRVLARYPQRQGQVAMLRQTNQGLSAARNTGIAHATGRYIGFLDSDDLLLPDYFTTLGQLLAENPQAEIVAFNARRFSTAGDASAGNIMHIVPGDVKPPDSAGHQALLQESFNRSMWYAWARIYRAALFDGALFPAGRNFEDIQLIPQLYLMARSIVTCSTPLVGYRVNPAGITRAPKRRDLDDLDYALGQANIGRRKAPGNHLYSILFVTTLKARLLVGLDFCGLPAALRETALLRRQYARLCAEEQRLLSRKNRLFYRSPLAYYLLARLYNRGG